MARPINGRSVVHTLSACPADTALGKSISVDFTQSAVDSFTAAGNPTYSSDGVTLTVAKSGDAPTLTSLFYIMFGKVSVTMKAAPGAGIVSSLVLQSDDLDEIDMEWIGADDNQVQTNYFGKGDVTTYNRGEYNPAAGNQDNFITYTVEWTSSQVVWSVGSSVVRVLTPATADSNQYPQTPMQVKLGAWSGGDPSNAPGTIAWAQGPTDYSKGPFSMVVKSIDVSDYSTGTSYSYSGNSGSWQNIVAAGGAVNGNAGSAASTVAIASSPSATSASPSVPAGIGKSGTTTQTGWPWVTSTTLQTTTQAATSVAGIPSGWTVSGSGKIVPSVPTSTSLVVPAPSSSSPASPPSPPDGYETITGWDDRGFATTRTVVSGYETMPKSYDNQGFLITPTAAPVPAASAVDEESTSATETRAALYSAATSTLVTTASPATVAAATAAEVTGIVLAKTKANVGAQQIIPSGLWAFLGVAAGLLF
ncbi:MAG: hypothetical protein M1818_001624 [Claussenomyces sp. TS43310]|nr:MAG: hypothetical protein M1818_001624 [Claussenomyces sp. TS43310]